MGLLLIKDFYSKGPSIFIIPLMIRAAQESRARELRSLGTFSGEATLLFLFLPPTYLGSTHKEKNLHQMEHFFSLKVEPI